LHEERYDMQNKKNILGLLLLIPFIWAISTVSYAVNIETNSTVQNTILFKQNISKTCFQSVPLSTKKTDNLIDESETEFETEFDSFYDNLNFNYTHIPIKVGKKSLFPTCNAGLRYKIPLYDLFCNWKFHIL